MQYKGASATCWYLDKKFVNYSDNTTYIVLSAYSDLVSFRRSMDNRLDLQKTFVFKGIDIPYSQLYDSIMTNDSFFEHAASVGFNETPMYPQDRILADISPISLDSGRLVLTRKIECQFYMILPSDHVAVMSMFVTHYLNGQPYYKYDQYYTWTIADYFGQNFMGTGHGEYTAMMAAQATNHFTDAQLILYGISIGDAYGMINVQLIY
jgi:hypothetical protein